jgi:3-dehydroquinate dehydratase II
VAYLRIKIVTVQSFMQILIINGPNLNLLGTREPQIYGKVSFEQYLLELRAQFVEHVFTYFQSNHEGDIIDCLHASIYNQTEGILINAGAYTHTSIAIADALSSIAIPAVEVHISNIYLRESFRHISFLKPVCKASIVGLGLDGYAVGVEALVANTKQ